MEKIATKGTASLTTPPMPGSFRVLSSLMVLILFAVYLSTICPSFLDDDSPETTTAGVTLGIQHPPGYPLAALTIRLASLFPVGAICFRVNLFSAFLSCLAAFLFASNVRRLFGILPVRLPFLEFRSPQRVASLLSLAAAFLLAFSHSYWEKALGAKGTIYLLETLILLGLLRCLMEQKSGLLPGHRWFYLSCFLFGTGLAHHWQTQVLFLPVLILFFLRLEPDEAPSVLPTLKNFILALGLGGLGISSLLYLPLRAHLHPVLNWGAPDSFPRFIAAISRQYYSHREMGTLKTLSQALTGTLSWPALGVFLKSTMEQQGLPIGAHFLREMKMPTLLLALIGVFYWRLSGEKKIFLGILLPFFSVLLALYIVPTNPDMSWYLDNFLIPTNWMVSLLAAVGMGALLSLKPVSKSISISLLLAFSCLPLYLFFSNLKNIDEERQMTRYDYGTNLMKSLSSHSVFFAEGDEDYFPFYYLQNVEHKRPDVRMIPAFTLFETWGVEQTERLFPDLGLTASSITFPDHFARIIYALSEIVVKNRDARPCAFSYFDGAFHRFYLSRNPSLLLRRSGNILELARPALASSPVLSLSGLRLRRASDDLSNLHPSLLGIWNIYQSLGLFPRVPLNPALLNP